MAKGSRYRESGRLATLGSSLKAGVELVVTCKICRHQAKPNVAKQVNHHGDDLTLLEGSRRLVCSKCGSREVDFVVSGYRGRSST